MVIRRVRIAAALASLAFPVLPAFADVVVLKDGKTLDGEVTEKGESYEVKTKYGTLTVEKRDVKEIVKDAAAMAAEAEALHKVARSLYDEGLKIEGDAKGRNRKLAAALELMEKALGIYNKARAIFPGDEYASLDDAAKVVIQEMRLYRDKMTTEQAPPPAPAPAPAPAKEEPPAPEPEPVAVTPEPAPAPAPPAPEPAKLDTPPPPAAAKGPAPAAATAGSDEPAAPAKPVVPARPASPAGKLLAGARQAAEKKRYAEAWSQSSRLLKMYPDSEEAAEAKAFQETLPHPDGRLVNGFDTDADIKAWRVYRRGNPSITFELATDEKEVKEGEGAGRFSLGATPFFSPEAIALELKNFDERAFRGLSLWIHCAQASKGRLELAFIRPNQNTVYFFNRIYNECIYAHVDLNWVGWRQVKLGVQEFKSRGKFQWQDVGGLLIYDATEKGCSVVLDSLRFQEAEKK